ncbi:putative cytochrome P450 [Cadophora sp. MPI-SDFR-AT-0126]|nr:putative cytochrome P450 [Leotiomycetes sp. MPI-SDFR-AT-0126]
MSTFIENRSPVTLALLALTSLYTLYHLSIYLITSHRRNLISRKHGCKSIPSYPHKDPIFGLDIFLENSRLVKDGGFMETVLDRYNRMNAYTYTQLFLGDRVINTAEPENIKAVLATQFKDFELPPRRKVAFRPTFGHGIFTTDGKEWEASRSLLRPNFTRSQVGDLETFESHIGKLIERIPRNGETVDLQQLFFMLTMDSATEFLFGTSSGVLGLDMTEERERGVKFQEAFTYVTERMGIESRVGKLATLFPNKRMDDSIAFVHEYIGKYIRKAIELRKSGFEEGEKAEEGRARYVFLEELAKQNIGKKKIQDELLNILLAGRDTTASLLSYLFYTLARRKDVFGKLKAEVDALGGETPSFEYLKSMKYLQYTLNEILRLHPIVPGNSRTCVNDTTLPVGGGPDQKSPIFVKKGTQINYQVYVMHRRKDLYGEDADEFRPERWEALRPSWQYLPFNGGPRICIGQQFALTEAAFTTVRLLQAFKGVEPRDDAPFTDFLTLTAAVRGGVKVAMIPA